MAKVKFSINKETLVVQEQEDYLLTRVPNSNMQYYWLLHQNDIVASDDVTLIVECDSEKEISLLPSKGGHTPPDIKQAISEISNPMNSVYLKADELYGDYYHYKEGLDPEQRAEMKRIRDQKREEALSRLNTSKDMREAAKQSESSNTSTNNRNVQVNKGIQKEEAVQNQPMTPAQQMAQQRAQQEHYSKQQFKEILKGTRQRLDTSLYRNINLSPQQMKELRLSMKAGLDVSKYNSPFISAKHMKEIRIGAKRGVKFDMDKLDHSLYNAEQIHELRLGFEKKLDVKKYLDPSYEAGHMKELRLAMQAGLDTTRLEDIHLSVEQMHTIRHQMVLSNLGDILKRFFERIREIVSDFVLSGMERASANMLNREPLTLEEMKEATMQEAINDIKYTLVESEILPTRAYDDKDINDKIREQIEELVSYMDNEPEADIQKAADATVEELCQAVGAEVHVPREEKVVNINQSNKQDNIVSAEQMNAISDAIDEQLGRPPEPREFVMEEESFAAMQ